MIFVVTDWDPRPVMWDADDIAVDHGVLLVLKSNATIVATYASGQWVSAYRDKPVVRKP